MYGPAPLRCGLPAGNELPGAVAPERPPGGELVGTPGGLVVQEQAYGLRAGVPPKRPPGGGPWPDRAGGQRPARRAQREPASRRSPRPPGQGSAGLIPHDSGQADRRALRAGCRGRRGRRIRRRTPHRYRHQPAARAQQHPSHNRHPTDPSPSNRHRDAPLHARVGPARKIRVCASAVTAWAQLAHLFSEKLHRRAYIWQSLGRFAYEPSRARFRRTSTPHLS
jgi:hypothetical protein